MKKETDKLLLKIKIKELNGKSTDLEQTELLDRADEWIENEVYQSENYKKLKEKERKIINDINKISFISPKAKLLYLTDFSQKIIQNDDEEKSIFVIKYLCDEIKYYAKSEEYINKNEDILNKMGTFSKEEVKEILLKWLDNLKTAINENDMTNIQAIKNDIYALLVWL